MSFSPAAMIARQSASNRRTSSTTLSSTMNSERAPRPRASRMSAITRSIGYAKKFRPRISMIEQKLQSNVHPRDVSITSATRPSTV
jgi:hypothetical protein